VQVHHVRGEHDRVVELATANLAALPADWIHEISSVWDRGWLVMSLAQLGRFAEATEPGAEAIRLAAPTKHAFTVGWAHFAAGSVPMRRGDWAQALLQYERVIAVCRAAKIVFLMPLALAPIPLILAQLGEAGAALGRLKEIEQHVARQSASGGSAGVVGPLLPWMGRAALALGRLDDARDLGARTVEAFRHHPGYTAEALQLLGDIASHQDGFDAENGERHYREALSLATSRGMRPLVAHCHLGLGKIYRRTGRHAQARDHLTAAATMYREMGMPFYLEQAKAEMTALTGNRGRQSTPPDGVGQQRPE
jgi:tetratricopeptide (TPR) repeat protein